MLLKEGRGASPQLIFMCKTNYFNTVFLTAVVGLLVSNLNAQTNMRVLKASTTVCNGSSVCLNWTDSITGNYNSNTALNVGGGYWDKTYSNTDGFGVGGFNLSHSSSWGSYWEGLTSGANGDTRNFGFLSTDTLYTGSVNWVPNQWGVMAGGGLDAYNIPQKGLPYFVAHWGYYNNQTNQFDMNNPSVKISLAGDSLFTAHEIYISNHPWPYYGNIYGDGFARPLNQPGDYFKLIIHAVYDNNLEDSIVVDLAFYDDDDEILLQSDEWIPVPLTALGSNVKSLYFTMKSTDELVIGDINYGPNTAVYFCMDKLKVTTTGEVASSSIAMPQAKRAASAKAVEVTDYFPLTSYTGGTVLILDENGTEILRIEVKADEKINLSKLPAGSYRLQHGNKIIPITKKGGIK